MRRGRIINGFLDGRIIIVDIKEIKKIIKSLDVEIENDDGEDMVIEMVIWRWMIGEEVIKMDKMIEEMGMKRIIGVLEGIKRKRWILKLRKNMELDEVEEIK